MSVSNTLESRSNPGPSYFSGDLGRHGGGTFTGQEIEPTIEAYENIFGPSARDIKQDLQRFKRHGRWHLPDILKGPNMYLTDRVDGLITDPTNSPFTSRILPYKFITNVDGKIKWNVMSFDEGLASRVPYESAARVLTQTKRSFAGYTVRSGLAMVLEHNFMMSAKGQENFKNELKQLVGSIQLTNDLDVHMALVLAESYSKKMREDYLSDDKSSTQICRQFVDLFGFVQKSTNAMDILIEEAKNLLRQWGGPMPDFLLCNGKLTFMLTMNPEVTSYSTQGPEGPKRLKRGPDIHSYRGIDILNTRAFTMETGAMPRDILRRRVRVAEYYRIPPHPDNYKRIFQFFNEERDTWFNMTFLDLLKASLCDASHTIEPGLPGDDNNGRILQTIEALQDRQRIRSNPQLLRSKMIMNGSAAQTGRHITAGGVLTANRSRGMQTLGALPSAAMETQGILHEITLFLEQLLVGRLRTEFVFPYAVLDKSWVYVPGAFDSTFAGHASANLLHFLGTLPPYLAQAVKHVEDAFAERFHGREPVRSLNFLKFAVQSVAEYPRNLQPIVALTLPVPYPHALAATPYTYAAPAGPVDILGFAPAVYTPGFTRFIRSYRIRDYLRYSIPLDCITDVNARTFESALDLTVDPAANEFSQRRFRQIGAFFSPNHFMQRKSNMYDRLHTIGDQIGYNIILTEDLVNLMTSSASPVVGAGGLTSTVASAMFRGTFIYDVLRNPDRHQNFLEALIVLLNATKTSFLALGQDHKRRAQLTNCFLTATADVPPAAAAAVGAPAVGPAVPQTFEQMMGNTAIRNAAYLPANSLNANFNMYWMWPDSESTSRDSLHHDSMHFAGKLFFQAPVGSYFEAAAGGGAVDMTPHLNITNGLITGIITEAYTGNYVFEYAKEREPFLAFVDLMGYGNATRQDALNFLHMLAWRLFQDQYKEIRESVIYRGKWGDVDDYLRCTLPAPSSRFGGGLMDVPPGGGGGGGPPGVPGGPGGYGEDPLLDGVRDIEIVVVRPNIEHYMLGIILGKGGEQLGSTFWGQTELSCYDDSMHGIWGMSYKYNSRAIVTDNKNLVRMWDIAYDSYVGGKNDTYVEWNQRRDSDGPNSVYNLKEYTQHVSRHYRGPSMLVMAFHHSQAREMNYAMPLSNWPSPIVFHDEMRPVGSNTALPTDFDNLHVVDTDEFRVFNADIYRNAYRQYFNQMPQFTQLHRIRKNAGQSTAENEVGTDSLAFQGTMRVTNEEGRIIEEIHGSGHHGVDFTGVSSVRNGRGYKNAQSQPEYRRLI